MNTVNKTILIGRVGRDLTGSEEAENSLCKWYKNPRPPNAPQIISLDREVLAG